MTLTDAEKDAALHSLQDEIARQYQEIHELKEKLYGSRPSRHKEKHIVRRLRDYEYETAGPATLRGLRQDAADEIVFTRVAAILGVIAMWALMFLPSWFGFTPAKAVVDVTHYINAALAEHRKHVKDVVMLIAGPGFLSFFTSGLFLTPLSD